MYDFDKAIDRRGTTSIKWNKQYAFGQKDGLLPFWIADTDFACVHGNPGMVGAPPPMEAPNGLDAAELRRGHRYLFYPERSGAKGREGPGIYTGI